MYAAIVGPNVKWGAPISNGGGTNWFPYCAMAFRVAFVYWLSRLIVDILFRITTCRFLLAFVFRT